MPANHGPTHDASMYPALRSLALETLFNQMKNGETDSDRRIAAIAALRYLTIVEDPRRNASAPKSPPPDNSPPTQPSPPRGASTPSKPTAAANVHPSSNAFAAPRAAAQASAQTAAHQAAQVPEPTAQTTSQNSEAPAAASPPRLVHPRAKRNSHMPPLLPSGNPQFVSTFAPAFLSNPNPSGPRAGASP